MQKRRLYSSATAYHDDRQICVEHVKYSGNAPRFCLRGIRFKSLPRRLLLSRPLLFLKPFLANAATLLTNRSRPSLCCVFFTMPSVNSDHARNSWFEIMRQEAVLIYSKSNPGIWLKEITKPQAMMAPTSAEIWTQRLPNTKPESNCFINLLGGSIILTPYRLTIHNNALFIQR